MSLDIRYCGVQLYLTNAGCSTKDGLGLEKYQISSLKTYRVNQDTCEQTFGTLRALGGNNDRMDAVDFIYRLARFCMGAGKGITVEKANILFNNGAKTLTIAGKNNRDLIDDEPIPDVMPEPLPVKLEVKFRDDGKIDRFLEHEEYLSSLKHLDYETNFKGMNINSEAQPGTSTSLTPMETAGYEELGGYFSKKMHPNLQLWLVRHLIKKFLWYLIG